MDTPDHKTSRLIPVLREGVAVIQMIFFKELKTVIEKKYPDRDAVTRTMLTGAITNELFGTQNQEEKFLDFCEKHRGEIEQEMISLPQELPEFTHFIADALRIQTLCDHQEGLNSEDVLKLAQSCRILPEDRELPLPSTFMETVRKLGKEHNLLIPPVEIDHDEDQTLLQ